MKSSTKLHGGSTEYRGTRADVLHVLHGSRTVEHGAGKTRSNVKEITREKIASKPRWRYYGQPGRTGVYALKDPRTGTVRYVGASINIEARWRHHGNDTSGASRLKKELAAVGLRPTMEVLETTTKEHLRAAEFRWIAHFREMGQADMNVVRKRTPLAALREENALLKQILMVLLLGEIA